MRELKELFVNAFKLAYHTMFIIGLLAVLVYLIKDIKSMLF